MLYSTLQSNYTIYVVYLGGRDLVYNGWWHGLNSVLSTANYV